MTSKINQDIKKIRREAGQKSLKAFAEIYFSHYLEQPMCSFHEDLYQNLYDISGRRNERNATASPRNSAKSSICTTIYPVWSVCYGRESYIVILSDTKDKAVDFLSHIKNEFENNEKLINDFPDVCGTDQNFKPRRWKKDEIIINKTKITALGSGQKLRGRRSNQARPSLILLDDVENEANTQSGEAREKLFNWFTRSILKAGTQKTNVIVIGTILHYDSLLAKLTDKNIIPGWNKSIYKSVISWATHQDLWQKWSAIFNYREDYMGKKGKEAASIFFRDNREKMLEGTSVLWPERESYYDLMVMREQEGELSFDSEKQNSPVNLKDCPFNPEGFYYWDDQFPSEIELLQTANFTIYGGCDPSLATGTVRGDYSSVITLARDGKTGIMYILDADIAKKNPDELVETILTYCRMRNYQKFTIEVNQFQELLKREIERRGAEKRIYPHIEGIKNTSDKISRILSLQPLIKSGYIRFSRKHTMLIEQLRYFPKGAHDDGPDALEMTARIAKEPGKVTVTIVGGDNDDWISDYRKNFGWNL